MTLPPAAHIDNNAKDMKTLRPDSAADMAMIGVYTLQGDVEQDLVYLSQIYEEARQVIGITDSFQGRADRTATSGKAKEFAAAQSAGRLESKRVMKNAAYETIQAYKAAETNQEKRDIIRNADMPGEAKAVMYYQLMASDNEKVQMDLLRDAGEDMGKVVEQYLDIRDQNEAARAEAEAENNTEKSRKEMLEILGEAGLGIEDATVAEMEKDTIWANRSLNETEKRAEFVRWLNETDYSDEEREAIRDAILSEGSGTTNRYENLINRGIDDDIA